MAASFLAEGWLNLYPHRFALAGLIKFDFSMTFDFAPAFPYNPLIGHTRRRNIRRDER
jgi:hypothetical protein